MNATRTDKVGARHASPATRGRRDGVGRRGARPFAPHGMRPVGFFERGSGMPDPYAPREWRSEPVGARHASPATRGRRDGVCRRGSRPFMPHGMRPVGFFERGSGMPDPYAPREWQSEPVGARHASPATRGRRNGVGRRGARPFMPRGMRPVGFFERGSGMPDPYAPREWQSEPVGARHASPAKTQASPAINRNN